MAKIITVKDMNANAIGKLLTGYNCDAGNFKWRIFHVDGKNVYIITDDYIPFNVAPLDKKGTPLRINGMLLYFDPYQILPVSTTRNDYECMLSFDDVVRDYIGIQDITDERIKSLNSLYFKANTDKNTNLNIRSVAYMLDTKAWSEFAGEKAEYAIGGPTLEIFVKSYNLTHELKLKICSDEIGYMITYEDESEFLYSILAFESRDDLYFKESIDKACGMWLASPSADGSDYLKYVHCSGHVFSYYYTDGCTGLRPLVCLKSNIRFEETEAGFKII